MKLKWQCEADELAEIKSIWHAASNLDEVAKALQDTCLPFGVYDSPHAGAEQPAEVITQAPLAWQLLEAPDLSIAENALQWLLHKCFGNKLASLKLSRTGQVIPLDNDERQPPHIRLHIMMSVLQERRRRWTRSNDEILPFEIGKALMCEWQDDYTSWMSQAAQEEWYKKFYSQLRNNKWRKDTHHFEKSRFRNFLWKMCGCYELVLFFVRVQPSWHSLAIFHEFFIEEKSTAVEKAVKRILQDSRS